VTDLYSYSLQFVSTPYFSTGAVSIACDFRYAYFSVLGATIGILWLVSGGSRRESRVAGRGS
jgi:hypothetical protein